MSAPALRPYQVEMLTSICDAFSKKQNRLLCKAPTGSGKTISFAAMLKHPPLERWLSSFPKKGAKMLVIAHREELLDQAADKIQKANPGLMVSIEQGDRYANRYSDVVIASIQTLAAVQFRRLKRLMQHHAFRLVIVDEAHHAAAASYRTALVHLGFLPPAEASESEEVEAADFDDVAQMEAALKGWDAKAPKDRLLVGVTATPNRSDAIGLGCVFQTIAYSYALKQAIHDGYLVPILPWVVETDTDLGDVKITAGDFNQKALAEAVNQAKRNQLAVSAWEQYAKGLPTIAFTVDVAHAHALAGEFRQRGIRASAVSGETPKEERRQILADYSARRIDVIANCMVLTEGTDLPLTECILHAKPTKSATLYEQMTGRGLRIHPGKAQCVVIDIADIAKRHSLQAAPVLYGLPPGIKANGDDLRKLEGDIEGLREKYPNFDIDAALSGGPMTLRELGAKASTFDVWTVPTISEVVRQAMTMNWIKGSEEHYRLQYPWGDGHETVAVQKNLLNQWEVALTMRVPAENGWQTRQRTLSTGIPTDIAALVLAEQFVQQERRDVTRLKDRNAPWRTRPASPKQIQFLRRLRVPFNEKTVTMGQASDLIDVANARRGR